MKFINFNHETRFYRLTNIGKLSSYDSVRESVFYLLSGSDDLYNNIEKIYNLEERSLYTFGKYKELLLNDESVILLNVVYQLGENSYDSLTINTVFNNLNDINKKLVLNAIKLRYKIVL